MNAKRAIELGAILFILLCAAVSSAATLPTPQLLSPSSGATNQSKTLKLDWNDVSGATVYRVFVSTSYSTLSGLSDTTTSCSGCVINTTRSPSYYYVPSGALDGGTKYYWMVRAGNSSAGSYNSSIWNFTTASDPLPTPQLSSPSSGATNQSKTLKLDWNDVSGATTYRVFVSTSYSTLSGLSDTTTSCSGCVINTTRSSSYYNVPSGTLGGGTKYYWMVRAGNSSAGSENSSIWNFTTVADPLPTPQLSSPSSGATNQSKTLLLDWGWVSGATTYRVFVSTSYSTLSGLSDTTTSCSGCVINTTTSTSSYNVPSGTLNAGTKYYWMVRAGSSNAGSENSSIWNFTTVADPLPTPQLTSPSSGATNQSKTLQLDWNDVSGATVYRVFVSTSYSTLSGLSDTTTSCSGCVVNATPSTSYYNVPSGTLNAGTTYYWMVRAGNSNAGSVNSAIWSFMTAADTLPTPQLASPSNGATDQSKTLQLDWESVSGATVYRVFVSTSYSTLSGLDDTTTSCSGCAVNATPSYSYYDVQTNELNAGTTYYWMVRAGNSNAGSHNSSIWSFTTIADPLPTPEPLSPPNGSEEEPKTVTLDWGDVSDADHYRVFVSTSYATLDALSDTDKNCSGCVLEETPAPSYYNVPSGTLAAGTTYYWMVRAGNANAGSVNSVIWSFTTIADPLPTPEPLSPPNGSGEEPKTVMLDWDDVSGADHYRVFVSTSYATLDALSDTDKNCSGCVLEETPAPSYYNVPSGTLAADTTYYWMVRAGSANAGSVNSVIWSFTTLPDSLPTPVPDSPPNGSTIDPDALTLDWDDVSGADHYRVFVSTSYATLDALSDTDKNCSGCVLEETPTPSYYNVPSGTLAADTIYYWMVRAGSANAGSVNSVIWNFKTPPDTLATPAQDSPSNGAPGQSKTVTLDWGDVSDADHYRVFVSTSYATLDALSDTDKNCSGCVLEETPASSQQSVPAGILDSNTTYYWMVRAGNYTYQIGSVNSDIWSFTTGGAPAGDITAPAQGSSHSGKISINAQASDSDGLKKVSLVFVPNGTPLVLCQDGTSSPCSGTSGSWSRNDVDPQSYGASVGSITLGLHVQDDLDSNPDGGTLAASSTFGWSKAQITDVAPSGGDYRLGQEMTITWSYAQPSSHPMVLSIKRQYCNDNGTDICTPGDGNWHQFALDTDNDGTETVTVPKTINVAGDWEVYVGDANDSAVFTPSNGTININSYPTGSISTPAENDSLAGKITVAGSVFDADGIKKISLVFVPNGTPYVVCEDGTGNPCSGTDWSGTVNDVDPEAYGASEGDVTIGLHVQDDFDGNPSGFTAAASRTFNWSKTEITNVSPTSGSYAMGDEISVGWTYDSEPAAAPMIVSMKRDSCVVNGVDSCTKGDDDWRELTSNTPNDGTEVFAVPSDVNAGTDWRIYVKDADAPSIWAAAGGTLEITESTSGETFTENPCIGSNFEQRMPVPSVQLPEIVSVTAPAAINEGETASLTVAATVDTMNGGSSFFYWCADKGSFEEDPNSTNHESVIYKAGLVAGADEKAKVMVLVGDTLGYVAREVIEIDIQEIGNDEPEDPAPVVSIATPANNLMAGQNYPVQLTLSDIDTDASDTTYLLRSDIYYVDGGAETKIASSLQGGAGYFLWSPQFAMSGIYLKIVTTDGNSTTVSTTGTFDVYQEQTISDTETHVVDSDGRIVSKTVYEYDENGYVETKYVYDNYVYDGDEITGYERSDYDATGTITRHNYYTRINGVMVLERQVAYDDNGNAVSVYDYEQYTFDSSGRVSGYTMLRKDGAEALLSTSVYSDLEYYPSGRLAGYLRTDYDADGVLTSVYDTDLDEEGRVAQMTLTGYDSDGAVTASYLYDNYTYDDDGRATAYDYRVYDADAALVKRYEYRSIVYHSNGRMSVYERFAYDADGTLLSGYDYSLDENGEMLELVMTYYNSDGTVTGSNLYNAYTYNSEGLVAQYDMYRRDADGAVLNRYEYRSLSYHPNGRELAYVRFDYDSDGKLVSTYDFLFDQDGHLSQAVLTRYDADGIAYGTYLYSGYLYDPSGRTQQYDLYRHDANGTLLKRYEYRNIGYHANGRTAAFERFDYDADGVLISHYDYTLNQDGRADAVTLTKYDSDGSVSETYVYTGYVYDSSGNMIQCNSSRFDADGVLVNGYEYRNFTYYTGGRTSGYERFDYDADGTLIARYDYVLDTDGRASQAVLTRYDGSGSVIESYYYSGYLYDVSRRVVQYDLEKRDSGGTVIGKYEYRNYEYDSAGRVVSYTMKHFDGSGAFLGWYDYRSLTYGADGNLLSYDWIGYDEDGTVVGTGHWEG